MMGTKKAAVLPPPTVLETFFLRGANLGVNPKIGGKLPPKMDGENKGSKPYEQMDDLGGPPLFLETPLFWGGRISSSLKKMAGHFQSPKKWVGMIFLEGFQPTCWDGF